MSLLVAAACAVGVAVFGFSCWATGFYMGEINGQQNARDVMSVNNGMPVKRR